ncbi:hypothetical protein EYR41_006983 [Orbilia oligospora]|uniref:Uncharacterized protein n=2 Tax=Orbilia oligospora TaxID=2813651 RepID=A0A8H2DZU8_ORBOL|nr:hypothetical protein TWF132_011100 [Orbilia oligospora]TGJ67887.1 hypothetical protein EYR41_006983 [Orbilia oligospora]
MALKSQFPKMSEPLIDISPNKVYGTSQTPSAQPPLDDPINLASEDSEYSVIDYNIPKSFSSSGIGEKHLRSAHNSPMKMMKKPKYDIHDESMKENHDISFADDDEDFLARISSKLGRGDELTSHSMSFDTNLSGFSDVMVEGGVGVSRETEEQMGEIGERPVDRQILRESYRRERSMERGSPFHTPTKSNLLSFSTPNRQSWSSPQSDPVTPGTVTPRATGQRSRLATLSQYSKSPESTPGNNERTQNLLLDFTAQFNAIKANPPPQTPTRSRRRSQSSSPTKRTRDGSESPSKQPLPAPTPMERRFLLDFDIPPPPTPRSIPSVTPKEVENIKSQFLAQIAQLRAELAGKDAQINTLKDSVSDAERRASNGIVELRQVREEMEDMSARTMLIESRLSEAGRAVQEFQGQIEVGNRLLDEARNERDSVVQDKDFLRKELEELKREHEQVSDSLLKTKQDLASTKKDLIVERQKKSAPNSPARGSGGSGVDVEAAVEKAVAAANATKDMEVSQAVEKVAKELHSLYKSKHEQKVSALKQSYSKRWEKRVNELEAKNNDLTNTNNELSNKIMRMEEESEEHLNLSGPVLSPHDMEDRREEIEKLEAQFAKAQEQIKTLQEDLSAERREKGELVLAVDELLALGGAPAMADNGVNNLRGSISRASGASIAKALTPAKEEKDKETKSSSGIRGGIERMGNGANPSKGRFGFPSS